MLMLAQNSKTTHVDSDGVLVTQYGKVVSIHLIGYTGGVFSLPSAIANNKQLETIGYQYLGAGTNAILIDVVKTADNKISFLGLTGYAVSSVTNLRASITFVL